MTSLVPEGFDERAATGRTRTLHLKVQPECWAWLDQAAREVNQVWNWANETSRRAVQTYVGPAKWLSEFDLNNLSSGASKTFDRIGSDTIQRVNAELFTRRKQFKKASLRFRKSSGSKRSLGWIPFRGINLNLRPVKPVSFRDAKGNHQIRHKTGYRLTVMGKTIRLHQMNRLVEAWNVAEVEAEQLEAKRKESVEAERVALESGVLLPGLVAGKVVVLATGEMKKAARRKVFTPALGTGSFAQNALGEWFLNVTVSVPFPEGTVVDHATGKPRFPIAPKELVGLDPGLKAVLTSSDGERFEPNRSYRELEKKIAELQRRGHKQQAKYLHSKAANVRLNMTHQISRLLVNTYQVIKIGDVSLSFLRSGNKAKSALDSGLGMLKAQLHYKGHWAGRSVYDVNENYTTQTCSKCQALTGPTGKSGLVVRVWTCRGCQAVHDRDINAAINIARVKAKVQTRAQVRASVRGNKRDCKDPLRQPTPAMRNRDGSLETISS